MVHIKKKIIKKTKADRWEGQILPSKASGWAVRFWNELFTKARDAF